MPVSKRDKYRGFTLVELLIVVVVISILAAITLVVYTNIQQRARDSQRVHDVRQLTNALEHYYTDNGRYPSSGGCGSTTINSSWCTTADASWQNIKNTLKGYMGEVPSDPTSTPNGNVQSTGNYNYAYFSAGAYCNGAMTTNRGYILLYQLEGSSQTNTLNGVCTTSTVGPYPNASNFRLIK